MLLANLAVHARGLGNTILGANEPIKLSLRWTKKRSEKGEETSRFLVL